MNPKQLARVSLFHLKEATLNVLLQAWHENDEPITTKMIRERLGIPKAEAGRDFVGWGESLMWGILLHLKSEGRIECCQEVSGQVYKWKLQMTKPHCLMNCLTIICRRVECNTYMKSYVMTH